MTNTIERSYLVDAISYALELVLVLCDPLALDLELRLELLEIKPERLDRLHQSSKLASLGHLLLVTQEKRVEVCQSRPLASACKARGTDLLPLLEDLLDLCLHPTLLIAEEFDEVVLLGSIAGRWRITQRASALTERGIDRTNRTRNATRLTVFPSSPSTPAPPSCPSWSPPSTLPL